MMQILFASFENDAGFAKLFDCFLVLILQIPLAVLDLEASPSSEHLTTQPLNPSILFGW